MLAAARRRPRRALGLAGERQADAVGARLDGRLARVRVAVAGEERPHAREDADVAAQLLDRVVQLAARRLGGAQLLLEGLELLAAGRARARRVGLGRLEPPLQRRAGALRLGERPGLGRGVDLVRALDLRL